MSKVTYLICLTKQTFWHLWWLFLPFCFSTYVKKMSLSSNMNQASKYLVARFKYLIWRIVLLNYCIFIRWNILRTLLKWYLWRFYRNIETLCFTVKRKKNEIKFSLKFYVYEKSDLVLKSWIIKCLIYCAQTTLIGVTQYISYCSVSPEMQSGPTHGEAEGTPSCPTAREEHR